MINLTQDYIKAFDSKNLKHIEELLDENFILQDPVVKRISGKKECLKAIENIFKSAKNLSFKAKQIYMQNKTTFIEFELMLDDLRLEGVDIIEWKDSKMTELRAYLDPKGV